MGIFKLPSARAHPITHTLKTMRISFIAFTTDKKQANKNQTPGPPSLLNLLLCKFLITPAFQRLPLAVILRDQTGCLQPPQPHAAAES